ncbi:MAG: hypothetical protein AAF670_08545 [Planctomycetota bacterium]
MSEKKQINENEIDPRLSEFLDGQLDPSQRRQLESELQRDKRLAASLADLQRDQQSLRALFGVAKQQQPSLPKEFASRVLADAQSEAIRANLPTTHPLRKSIDNASDDAAVELTASVESSRRTRTVAWVVAAAASIALVANAWIQSGAVSEPETIAQSPGVMPETDSGLVGVGRSIADAPAEPTAIPAKESVPMIAFADNVETDSSTITLGEVDRDEMVRPTVDRSVASTESMAADTVDGTESLGTIASDLPGSRSAAIADSMMVSATPKQVVTGAILVYDVQLTREGRAKQSIRRAMQAAGLAATSRQTVGPDVVAAARLATEPSGDDGDYQILYLRAPARLLDRLFSILSADVEGVAALGMSLSMDGPITGIASDLEAIDPTTVRSDAVSYDVAAESDDATRLLASMLSSQPFMPLPSRAMPDPTGQPEVGLSLGTDITSQVLVLVR